MRFTVNTGGEGKSGCGGCTGKIGGSLFFGVFLAMGLMFVVLVLGEAVKTAQPWFWGPVPCTVLDSGVAETDDEEDPYLPVVRYRYEIAGREYESDRFHRSENGTASFDKARDQAGLYIPGAPATCYVDPDQPALAVLERGLPWIALVALFPMIFVAIGAGGLWFIWRWIPSAGGEEGVQSISQQASGRRGHLVMVVFGLIFTVVGAATFIPLFALPMTRLALATTWVETPCTVVSSGIRSWETDDGYSHRAEVLYEYEAGGRVWRSNRADFFSILSSGRDQARAMADRHPSGSRGHCYVHPSDPSKSVLERQFRPHFLLGALTLMFLIAGLAVGFHGLKKMHARRPTQLAESGEPVESSQPIEIEPSVGPLGKVVGALLFAVFWNGIVSVFVWQAWKSWQSGRPDWFLTLFLTPFVLVGLGAIGAVFYFSLAAFNPRPRVVLLSGHPRLGDTLHVEWSFRGRSGRIGALAITLEGREEATYRRGTDTHTDTEVFATLPLVETHNHWEIPRGSAEVVIPDDTMHSLEADNNKIVWLLKIAGDIPRWPDVDESLPLTVRPMRREVI
jgi:hypothetical protein